MIVSHHTALQKQPIFGGGVTPPENRFCPPPLRGGGAKYCCFLFPFNMNKRAAARLRARGPFFTVGPRVSRPEGPERAGRSFNPGVPGSYLIWKLRNLRSLHLSGYPKFLIRPHIYLFRYPIYINDSF